MRALRRPRRLFSFHHGTAHGCEAWLGVGLHPSHLNERPARSSTVDRGHSGQRQGQARSNSPGKRARGRQQWRGCCPGASCRCHRPGCRATQAPSRRLASLAAALPVMLRNSLPIHHIAARRTTVLFAGSLPRSTAAGARRHRREAPAQLADALGSHAVAAGSQRQQALARAASLLKLKPALASGRLGAHQRTDAAVTAGARPAQPAARSAAAATPPFQQQRAAPRQEAEHSIRPGSSRMQPDARASQHPAAQPAPHGACGAQPADGPPAGAKSSSGQAAAAPQASGGGAGPGAGSAGNTQQGVSQQGAAAPMLQPGSYFADARAHLRSLAAAANGLG